MRYVKINGGTATVKVDGRYDLCNTLDVMAELEVSFLNGCTKVKVDFSDTSEIDSAVIRDLQKICKRVKEENFTVSGAKEKVAQELKAAKLMG